MSTFSFYCLAFVWQLLPLPKSYPVSPDDVGSEIGGFTNSLFGVRTEVEIFSYIAVWKKSMMSYSRFHLNFFLFKMLSDIEIEREQWMGSSQITDHLWHPSISKVNTWTNVFVIYIYYLEKDSWLTMFTIRVRNKIAFVKKPKQNPIWS